MCVYVCACVSVCSRGCHDDEHARLFYDVVGVGVGIDVVAAGWIIISSPLCSAPVLCFVMADFKCDKWPTVCLCVKSSRAEPS